MKKNYTSPEFESIDVISSCDILVASGTEQDNDTLINVNDLFN